MIAVCGTIRIVTRHRPLDVISQLDNNERPGLPKQARSDNKASTRQTRTHRKRVPPLADLVSPAGAGRDVPADVAICNHANTSQAGGLARKNASLLGRTGPATGYPRTGSRRAADQAWAAPATPTAGDRAAPPGGPP